MYKIIKFLHIKIIYGNGVNFIGINRMHLLNTIDNLLRMKIKLMPKDTGKMLWNDSPCTLRNVLQNPSMDHAQRFHYGSIYFKDEVNKPKKVFTQFEKPELLLMNFRRQIEEVTLRAKKSISKHAESSNPLHDKKPSSKRSTSSTQNRFYERPPRLELKHDRHGNRSSYLGDYDIKDIEMRMSATRRNFYSSQRVDLSKPANFYPGPGTYFSQKDADNQAFRHTYSQRMKLPQKRSISLKK